MAEMTRRSFVAGAATTAGVAAAGMAALTAKADEAAEAPASTSWKTPPEPITDFVETIDADVVVVGAGAAGSVALLAAAANGAKAVCIQKSPYVLSHGRNYGALNSRFQAEAGFEEIDLNEIVNAHIRYNGLRPQRAFVQRIFEESAPTLEWLYDETGIEYTVNNRQSANVYPFETKSYSTGHLVPADMMAIGFSNAIVERAVNEYGAEIYFNMPGEQLVQDESGRVTGVVAKGEEGYMLFNAAKGVILATGDYGSNEEMCAEMCPWVVGRHNYYNPNDNTGDGHKMGTWVGAKMETLPHTKMAHVHNCIDGTNLTDSPIKSNPFLWVNQNGERFMNEESKYYYICNSVAEQPGDVFYLVFDSNYNQFLTTMWNPGKEIDPAALDNAVELGYASVADTIEEAAAAFDIPADAIGATVARYNELCEAGYDEDFGKPAADMQVVAVPPFYIVRSYTPMDVTMGGLMTDLDMQVIDTEGNVIEGLYAVGNCSGGFYGGADYDLEVDAFSLGRAATTGRLAGEHAAKK